MRLDRTEARRHAQADWANRQGSVAGVATGRARTEVDAMEEIQASKASKQAGRRRREQCQLPKCDIDHLPVD